MTPIEPAPYSAASLPCNASARHAAAMPCGVRVQRLRRVERRSCVPERCAAEPAPAMGSMEQHQNRVPLTMTDTTKRQPARNYFVTDLRYAVAPCFGCR